jgi:hypothetical protein
MLISTALLLDSIIRNSVCTPAKLPCRRVEVGYEKMKIYDYEQFIPGGTNNLHFADIRHPFLVTSNIIIFTIYPKPIASEET